MGAEQPKEEEKEPTIGEMKASAFFAVLVQLLERKRQAGDNKLMDMTVKEFTSTIVEQVAHRQLATATAETVVAERILRDWAALEAVQAIAQPFRVTNLKEARDFAASLEETLTAGTGRDHLVIAVAYVNGGAYRAVRK